MLGVGEVRADLRGPGKTAGAHITGKLQFEAMARMEKMKVVKIVCSRSGFLTG
jgi:hypothetical protein